MNNSANSVYIEQELKERKKALEIHANVYVSASAGTGKTKLLVDRTLSLLLHGNRSNNILCITYTNMAVKEMSERINAKLQQWTDMNEVMLITELESIVGNGSVNEDMLLIARNLFWEVSMPSSSIKICTMHSLCNTISTHFNVQNNRSIMDNSKKLAILDQSIDEVFKNAHASDIMTTLEALTEFYEISYIHKLICDAFFSGGNAFRPYMEQQLNKGTNKEYFDEVINPKLTYVNMLSREIAVYQEYAELSRLYDAKTSAYFADIVSEFKAYLNCGQTAEIDADVIWNKVVQFFLTQEMTPKKKLYLKALETHCCHIAYYLSEAQKRVIEVIRLYDEYIAKKLNCAFVNLLGAVYKVYTKYKLVNNIIEYDDIIFEAMHLLTNSEDAWGVLYDMDLAIDHILIDEAQDLNAMHWDVVKLIADDFFAGDGAREINRTIFLVGDFKQSIYGFQGAEPQMFLDAREYFKRLVESSNKVWYDISLNISFRSLASILSIVNKVCQKVFLEYGNINHIPYRAGTGIVEIFDIVPKSAKTNLAQNCDVDNVPDAMNQGIYNNFDSIWSKSEEDNAQQRLVIRIVELIDRIAHGPNFQKFSDIMILVRRRGTISANLRIALEAAKVPSYFIDSVKFNESIIVLDLISIAKFIVDPHDNLNLASLLKSPFFKIRDDEIVTIAINRGSLSIYDVLERSMHSCVKKLQAWRIIAKTYSVWRFYQHIIEQHNITEYDIFLNTFLDIAYEFSIIHNYAGYLDFIEIIMQNNTMFDKKPVPRDNKVKIMTIHSAKGLQSPIVILADAASSESSPYKSILWYNNTLYLNFSAKNTDPALNKAKAHLNICEIAEKYRLLYVAMTRAENELYVFGHEAQKFADSWYNLLNQIKNEEKMI